MTFAVFLKGVDVGSNDQFGRSVSASSTMIVVGSPGDDSSQTHVANNMDDIVADAVERMDDEALTRQCNIMQQKLASKATKGIKVIKGTKAIKETKGIKATKVIKGIKAIKETKDTKATKAIKVIKVTKEELLNVSIVVAELMMET